MISNLEWTMNIVARRKKSAMAILRLMHNEIGFLSLDYDMPGGNGYTLLEEIIREKVLPHNISVHSRHPNSKDMMKLITTCGLFEVDKKWGGWKRIE